MRKETQKYMEKDKFIYLYVNKINGHQYVGQTNNIQKRFNGHKSDSYNKNSHSYNYPLHNAIRKYGLENFSFEVIESGLTQEEANEREKYWIKEKKSHISQNGYNITFGGDGRSTEKLSWEELKERGKVFTGEEIELIQSFLIAGNKYDDIIEYFSPRLTRSFLSNINNGVNYKNPKLNYPLKKDFSGEGKFTKEEIKQIKEEIKSGLKYFEIQKKWNIKSAGFLSMINSGKYYFDPNEKYPLIVKGCADKSWIIPCLKDIIFSSDSLSQIAKKYNKADSTIKKLSQGKANKQKYLIYPIRSNIEQNKEIFNKYFI